MRIILAACFVLLAPLLVQAETTLIQVPTNAVSQIELSGEVIQAFDIVLPAELSLSAFLGASMAIGVATTELRNGLAELSVAQWQTDAAIIPEGKTGYVSEVVMHTDASEMLLDVSPIIKDALAAQQSSLTLVIGRLTGSELGGCTAAALNEVAGIWCTFVILARSGIDG